MSRDSVEDFANRQAFVTGSPKRGMLPSQSLHPQESNVNRIASLRKKLKRLRKKRKRIGV